MQNKISKLIVVFGLAVLAFNPLFTYAQVPVGGPLQLPIPGVNEPAKNNTPATSPGVFKTTTVVAQQPATSSTEGLPVYNGGVDQSIQDYLCTPSEPADGHDLERCVNRIYKFSISAGAFVVVFLIVFAGYMYITGGEAGKTSAKKYINSSLTGMAVLLGSYVLLSFINPSLVVFKPIQPPIFDAADLPSCGEVGFGERCLVESGGGGISTGGGGECSIPIADSSVNGTYNNTIHGRKGHGPVRSAPNSPTGEGIVDIGAKGGSPVFSAISGKVVKISPLSPPLGSYASIISDTSGGAFDCQKSSDCANEAHIDFSVKVGDIVKAGQQIGVLATYTGGMGPHLHLELKLGGQWIMGDGFKKTWENQKAACRNAKAVGGGSGGSGGGAPAGMVDAKSVVSNLVVDMQYASASPSSNNFMKTAFYTGENAKYGSTCYLTKANADKLKVAADALTKVNSSYKLKAWDCYRPKAVQVLMREWADKQTPKVGTDKIAVNSNHQTGLAIDLTIDGLSMPTKFDDFANSAKSNSNSEILRKAMVGAGFNKAKTEWWHFD